jgi:hypothetical protein
VTCVNAQIGNGRARQTGPVTAWVHRIVSRNPRLAAVLVAGLVLRVVLIPITHGQDFVVWNRASAATLHGVNVYAHHPRYPGGPFAYFPVFLYIELPFQWLAQHTALSFVVLGKLPMVAADIACAALIAGECRRRGATELAVAVGAALYFLNPLVLYNSAYYGRFDSLGLALLLAAYRAAAVACDGDRDGPWAGAIWYALAVAAKTFPVFVLPWCLRWNPRGRWRLIAVTIVVVVVACLPYVTSLHPLLTDVVSYDVTKTARGLSWQYLLNSPLGRGPTKLVSYCVLIAFAAGAARLSRVRDSARCTALTFILFILCSKVVLEQYLTWPMPWLAVLTVLAVGRARVTHGAMLAVLTLIGAVDNESWHPFGRSSLPLVVLLTASSIAYLVVESRRRQEVTADQIRAKSAARTA